MSKFCAISLLLLCNSVVLNSQIHEIQVGVAVPQGDFASSANFKSLFNGSGSASHGYYVGYKSLNPLIAYNLFFTYSLGIQLNDFKGIYTEDPQDEAGEIVNLEYAKYINVPLMVGLHYEMYMSHNMNLFAEAAVGLNVMKLTDVTIPSESIETSYKFKYSYDYGYKFSAGIVFNYRYTLSMNIHSLGSHIVNFKETKRNGETTETVDKQFTKPLSISSINLNIGIRF